ncbi:MAG: LamG-like jellyroll fold domain-containing protein, partial [Candidatus Poribacteria bacterium]
MKQAFIILLTLATTLIIPSAFAANRVLSLDGDGDYVEVVDSESLNAINSQVTMEAWIKPTAFPNNYIAIINKTDKLTSNYDNRSYALFLNRSGFLHLASAPSGKGQMNLNSPSGSIDLNTWYHVTGVINAKNSVMRIFLNGAEVASGAFGKDIHVSSLPLWIGWTHEAGHGAFAGQIDEVRIWNTARTQEEIRATMHTTLSGKETGLVGYWRFDVGKNITLDSSQSHADGKLYGDAHGVEAELPQPEEVLIPTVVSGSITAENGNPIQSATVRLEQDGEEITQTQSDAEGNYWLVISEKEGLRRGLYDLSATKNELGDLRLGIRLREGESRTLNLTLKEAISIEGKLMMLDDITPHVAVVVQAVSDGKRIATVLSDEEGKYRFINLKPGQYQVRCYTTNGYVYYQNGEILRVQRTSKLSDINFHMAPFKKGMWRHYTSLDGLPYNAVNY